MPRKLTTLALAGFGTVLLISAVPGARPASGERPAAPVDVLNFPLDGAGTPQPPASSAPSAPTRPA